MVVVCLLVVLMELPHKNKIYSSKFNNIDNSLNNFMNNLRRSVDSTDDDYENFLNTMIVLTSLQIFFGFIFFS